MALRIQSPRQARVLKTEFKRIESSVDGDLQIVIWIFFIVLCFCCCSVAKSYLTLCDLMDCSAQDFYVLHYLQELAQAHFHLVDDAIQPSYPL